MSKRNIIITVILTVVAVAIAAVVYFTVDFDSEPKDTEGAGKLDNDEPQTSETTVTSETTLELDPSLELQIREDFYNKKISEGLAEPGDLPYIQIERYLGNYSGCEVVCMLSAVLRDSIRTVEVAGYEVVFPNLEDEAWVYKNGKFYTLVEGYELGLITKGDVYEIGKKVGSEFELNYPEPLEELDPLLELQIREDYLNKRISEGLSEPGNLPYIQIERYLGNYSGCEVVCMENPVQLDAFRPVEVAGYEVVFPNFNDEAWVYKNGKFYTLVEGYELGLITKSDVYEIGKKVGVEFELNYPEPLED